MKKNILIGIFLGLVLVSSPVALLSQSDQTALAGTDEAVIQQLLQVIVSLQRQLIQLLSRQSAQNAASFKPEVSTGVKIFSDDVKINTGSRTAITTRVCAQDVYTCSDGTVVGRTGSDCRFVCPAKISPGCKIPDCSVGSKLVERGMDSYGCQIYSCVADEFCRYYYWHDETSINCGYSKFCGLFMTQGLEVFDTLKACEDDLNSVVCAQDVYTCSDGTIVGRTGLDCRFVCPLVSKTYHSADLNKNYVIEQNELDEVIVLHKALSYHCDKSEGAAGYAPGYGSHECSPHNSDYMNGADWVISTSELLRLIQFFNSKGYMVSVGTEDGFAPLR